MSTPNDDTDDDLPGEIDFSQGTRGKFHRPGATVQLPAETADQAPPPAPAPAPADDPAFGMWSDRQDMADVAAYIRCIRAPRFATGLARRPEPAGAFEITSRDLKRPASPARLQ